MPHHGVADLQVAMQVLTVSEASGQPVAAPRSPIRRRIVGWLPRVRAREVAPLGVLTVASIVGTALSPMLRHDGLLLALMSPRLLFLGVAARQVSAVPFVVLLTIRLCLADPFHYLIGRRHGSELLARSGRLGRLFAKYGSRASLVLVIIAIRPVGRHLMWAGTKRINPLLTGAVDIVATALFCVAVKTGVDLLPFH